MTKNNIQELIEAQNQPFECAVFSGGGAKGAIYSGAQEALIKSGVLDGLKVVAGSSAGAITAAFIASGLSQQEFQRISGETNLKGLLGKGFLINKDGKPLYELIASTISGSIVSYLKDADIINIAKQRLEVVTKEKQALSTNREGLSKEEIKHKEKELETTSSTLQSIIDNGGTEFSELKKRSKVGGKIYFKDLALLRILDPIKFKDLIVTATRKDTGELAIFDSRSTPDVEIALACRASASIPLFFQPVKIEGVEYVDGGYRDNIPLDTVKNKRTTQTDGLAEDISDSPDKVAQAKREGRTLALAFGSSMDDSANVAIYSAKEKIVDPGAMVKFLMDVVLKILARVGGQFKYSEEENKVHDKLRENALNTVVLDTPGVSTLSFDAAQEKAEYLHIKGYMQTARHFDNHGIAPTNDPNFEQKDFLLKVYEECQSKGIINTWKDKVVSGKEVKLKEILSFCKAEKWEGRERQNVLADFVKVAATARDGTLTTNTNTIKEMVNSLNNAYTPNVIKEDFIKLLEIDIKKDPRFSQDKGKHENLAKFKFDIKDFDKLIAKQKLPVTNKNDIKEKPAQVNTIKGTIDKEVNKTIPRSMSDRVTKAGSEPLTKRSI